MNGPVTPIIPPVMLTLAIDALGRPLVVGQKVRSFDFPLEIDGKLHGLDLEGERASYVEGILEAIGEDYDEGCRRYRIRVTRRMFGGREASRDWAGQTIMPPLNGTRSTLGGQTFGVLAFVSETAL